MTGSGGPRTCRHSTRTGPSASSSPTPPSLRPARFSSWAAAPGAWPATLLARELPADARYLGADISGTMTCLSRARLRGFGRRAQVIRADGTMRFPVADGGWDRFLAVYVFDLLSAQEARAAVAEASRLLRPGGLLCAVSLAPGTTPVTRLVSRAWAAVWRRAPGLVGGCRPISLRPFLGGWHVEHHALVSAWGLTSEVVIAAR